MDKYEVKDLMAMEHFLEEAAPGVVFPVAKFDPDSFGQPDAFDKLLEAMLRKYSQLEAQNAKLAAENHELTRKLDYFRTVRWNQASVPAQAILKECRNDKAGA